LKLHIQSTKKMIVTSCGCQYY